MGAAVKTPTLSYFSFHYRELGRRIMVKLASLFFFSLIPPSLIKENKETQLVANLSAICCEIGHML